MLIVIALGGNALLRRTQKLEAEVQRRNIRTAAAAIAEVAREHAVVVTHGNGPQVGLLALQAEAYKRVQPYPLDVLGAETEGMIGYLIEQELGNQLPGQQVATLLVCQDSFEGLVRIILDFGFRLRPCYRSGILDLDYRRCYADGFWRIVLSLISKLTDH